MPWAAVKKAVSSARSIAWDGCHKIYVLLDDDQTKLMASLGYPANDQDRSQLIIAEEMEPEQMLKTLHEWYDDSCALRFISSVRTNKEDPDAGFTSLISQFEEVK